MPTAIIMPRVDMDMTTGRIARWLVEQGATVTAGQPLFEIETDKATMEIDAAAAGTIHILCEASDTDIKVGSVVAEIRAQGEMEIRAHGEMEIRAPDEPERHAPVETETRAVDQTKAEPTGESPKPALPPQSLRATPLARRQAQLRDIDLAAVTGSGPRGRVTSRDIDNHAPLPAKPPHARPDASPETTIVYLHGFAGSAASWAPLRARNPQFRHLALDLPGHGSAPPLAVATIDALTEAMIAACQRTTGGPIHLVGHSLGGAIGARIAASGRLPVSSLLLIAPAGLGPEIDGAFIDGILRARTEASLTPWLERLFADPAHLRAGMTAGLLALLDDPSRRAHLADLAAHAFPDGTQSAALTIAADDPPMPVRLVIGTADRIIPFRGIPRIGAAVGVHLCPGIGHMPQIEAVPLLARIQRELHASAGDPMMQPDHAPTLVKETI